MQAIFIKYISATNTKGSRIKAFCDAGSITIPYPHELNHSDIAPHVAKLLMEKLGWTSEFYGEVVCGGAPRKSPYMDVAVILPKNRG